jgi:hypothetical protein
MVNYMHTGQFYCNNDSVLIYYQAQNKTSIIMIINYFNAIHKEFQLKNRD